jgi:hypothetical protein
MKLRNILHGDIITKILKTINEGRGVVRRHKLGTQQTNDPLGNPRYREIRHDATRTVPAGETTCGIVILTGDTVLPNSGDETL